ncbi:hypothetical protein [Actinocrispum wychmicini]|uniref:ANTAR domain-containing protein n=1 Tax=Actinocrispum wychmicini TaxID=1213861 RepID=A0A4R2K0B6_9PSEU|nr:hypothetical protein [Actinocrispum wychmicini]TCO65087.1 hypothetical protein EV192_101871 [Actinocrispum wychmicini]
MDLHDLVAAQVERAWQAEVAYDRLVADRGISPDHAGHLLRFAVQRIAEGTTSTMDPYALATTWLNAR